MLHADKRQWLMGDPKEEFDQAYLKVQEGYDAYKTRNL